MDSPYKKKTISALKVRARENFRKYIRYRDTDENGNGKCITCNKDLKLGHKDCQAGHYDHNHNTTYHEEKNCHLQCAYCNQWRDKIVTERIYREQIDKLYGEGTAQSLIEKGRKEKRYVGMSGRKELWDMNQKYLSLIRELKSQKNE